jgi:hypothetical protein
MKSEPTAINEKNMKRILFVISLFQLFICANAQEKLFVAPGGSDNNPGTIIKPFRTIEAALKKVGNLHSEKVVLFLRTGRYYPSKTIDLIPGLLKNHHLTICNYENELVTITGAPRISPKWTTYKNNILKANVGKGLSFDQLFCNGKPLPMARYPNFDSSARVFNGTAADAISPERVRKWADPTGGFVHAIHNAEWGDFHYVIKAKIGDSLVLEGGWQNNRPAPMHREYRFVENIFEELDAPGEWYYNSSTGTLYFYPPKDLNVRTALFERSVLEDIIHVKGSQSNPAQNIAIKGIMFTGTSRTFMLKKEPLLRSDWTVYRSGAILCEGAKNVSINNCVFTGLGGNAVFVSKYNRNITAEHNYIHDIGANAFAFVGDPDAVRSPSFSYGEFVPIEKMDMSPGPKTDNYPAECKIYDNLIHNIGNIEKQIAGVEIDIAQDITVSHNTIYNVPRAGINIGDGCFGGHIIEFNDVFNTVLETGDHGAFNSWGRDRFWLPGIADVNKLVDQYPNLPLLDVVKPITLRNNRFQCEHGWDIDLDDGSTNFRIYNNLCLNGGLKLREGFYRVVENNVLVNNTFHPHVWYSKSNDVFAHNIVTSEYAPIRISVWGRMVDSNFFVQPAALAAAQKNGTDNHSLQGDPQFINAKAGDFRVKATSPVHSVGFKNFPMDEFGVVSGSLKKKAARPIITPVRTLETQRKGETVQWLGSVVKNVETLGEQSASGLPDKNGVLIVSVAPASITEKNGLVAGDVIRKINGKDVNNIPEMLNALQAIMWQGSAQATIWHNQQSKDFRLKLK